MSVADVLRKIGQPTKTSTLVAKTVSELGVSERQAYRLLKKAWKEEEIRKATLPDRGRINFLPEMSPNLGLGPENTKETLGFREAFLYRCFRQLEEISHQAVHGPIDMWGEPCKALQELSFFIARLPKEVKTRIEPLKRKQLEQVTEAQRKFIHEDKAASYDTDKRSELQEEYDSACLRAVRLLVDRVSTLLHEYQE